MKIGFLIGKVVENPDRKDELDILKVEYKIVYSWKILKKYEDLMTLKTDLEGILGIKPKEDNQVKHKNIFEMLKGKN